MNDQNSNSLPDSNEAVSSDETQRRADRRRQIKVAIGSLPLVLTIANSAMAYGPGGGNPLSY